MPAQCVFTYLRAVDVLLNKLIKCLQTKSTCVSSIYFDRKNSVLGKVSSIIGVIELQSDSRLHLHMLSYSSTMSPSLLSRVIPSDILREKVKNWIDSTCAASLSSITHKWLSVLENEKKLIPRSSEIPIASIEIPPEQLEELSEEELSKLIAEVLENLKSH